MKNLFVILFSFFSVLCYSQEDPINPSRIKGEGYALRDASGRIIVTESGGVLSIIQVEDTASSQLVLPPDTIQSFVATKAATDTFSSLTREIISYLTLEESSGDAIDSVGTVDLPVFGSVTRQQAGAINFGYFFTDPSYLGPIDTYFEFSGSFSGQCTINTTYGAWAGIMTNFGASNYGWELITSPSKAYWRMRYNGGNVLCESSTTINDGADHHLVFSYNHVTKMMKLYVDGVLEDSEENTNGTWYNSAARFLIGDRLESSAYFEGMIDEPALWNKEVTQKEVDSLFAKSQYPFPYQGSGGDSLRLQMSGFDARADTVMIPANPIGEGKSDSRTDGILLLAFNMADSADYNDTTILWPYLKDTVYIIEAYTGLIPEDTWTVVPNYTTVLIDSSDRSPPDQDFPGIWDTIFYEDWERHDAPIYYSRPLFLADYPTAQYRRGIDQYRGSDFRSPAWFQENMKDSIVIDPISGSKVLLLRFAGGYHDGYDGQSGRGGDYWKIPLAGGPYTEIYVSQNIMIKPGWMDNVTSGGKLTPAIGGGTALTHLGPQGYGEGFWNSVIWDWADKGNIAFYLYNQQTLGVNGTFYSWDDFQPTGNGITAGMYDGAGKFIYPDDDLTWINITVRYVTNTFTGSTPNYDGIIEGYVNGLLIAQWTGRYLITYPDIGNEINLFHLYQSFGGGAAPTPTRDEWSLNDDYIVFTYGESVDVPRGNELSPPGRVLNLPGEHKWE